MNKPEHSRNIIFTNDEFAKPLTMVSEHTELTGCSMKTKLVALIDGKLSGVTITSTDDSPIKVSALAVLTDCIIECKDLLIEGQFTGHIRAKGNVELGESALVQGEAVIGGTLVMNPLADTVELKLNHASPKKSAQANESRSASSGVYDMTTRSPIELVHVG